MEARPWDQRRKSFRGVWKRTPERIAAFAEGWRLHGTLAGASKAAGINRSTGRGWMEVEEIWVVADIALAEYEKAMRERMEQWSLAAEDTTSGATQEPRSEGAAGMSQLRRQLKRTPPPAQPKESQDPWGDLERAQAARQAMPAEQPPQTAQAA